MTTLPTRPRKLHVDAVVENDGLAAISVVLNGRHARPVVSRIIRASGSVEAEMRAVLLAMSVAQKARWDKVHFYCDANGVVRMIQGVANCGPENLQGLRDEAQRYMHNHPEWKIKWLKRTYNSSAHAMAGQIMRAYKHGREHGRQGEGPTAEVFELLSPWEQEVQDA